MIACKRSSSNQIFRFFSAITHEVAIQSYHLNSSTVRRVVMLVGTRCRLTTILCRKISTEQTHINIICVKCLLPELTLCLSSIRDTRFILGKILPEISQWSTLLRLSPNNVSRPYIIRGKFIDCELLKRLHILQCQVSKAY